MQKRIQRNIQSKKEDTIKLQLVCSKSVISLKVEIRSLSLLCQGRSPKKFERRRERMAKAGNCF